MNKKHTKTKQKNNNTEHKKEKQHNSIPFTRIIIISALVLVPAFGMYISLMHFSNQTAKTQNQLAKLQELQNGSVAGAETKKPEVVDLTNAFPIIDNAEISDVRRSDKTISLTVISNKNYEEIKNFYDDYFFENGWQQIDDETYTKDNKTLRIMMSDKIIKMELTK